MESGPQADEHVGFRVTRNSNVYCPALLPIFQQKVEHKLITLAEMSRLKRLPGYLKAAYHLFDDPTLPTGANPGLTVQIPFVSQPGTAMKQVTVPPEELGAFNQTFMEIYLSGRQPACQAGLFKKRHIGVDGMIRDAQAFAELGGVPELTMHLSQHFEQPFRNTRRCGEPPIG